MKENDRITKAFGVVGLCTLASRILGFAREVVTAYFYGAGLATDAFFVAFQLPNTFRRLLAEGSLTASFIPVFSETLVKRGKEEALKLANVTFTALTLILTVLTLFGVVFAPVLVKLMVWGFDQVPGKIELTVFLTRLMFPYIFFMSLVALCMGILNSLRHFFSPAFSPTLLSIAEIACVVALYHYLNPPILALTAGVMVGGFLQLAFQVPFLRTQGVNLSSDTDFRDPGLRRIGELMVPMIFGSAIYQVSILMSNFLASFLAQGSVSYLQYATRLIEFPLGIFVFSIGSVVLPSFSSLAAKQDHTLLKETYVFALRMAMFVIIPAMIGLIVLRVPVTEVIFERGSFTHEATLRTAVAVLYYALGLWAIAGVRVTLPVFYALHDTKTPVKVGVISLVATVVFSLLLMGPLQHGGLALAVSLSACVNLSLLLVLLRRKLGPLGLKAALGSGSKALLASLGMAAFCLAFLMRSDWLTSEGGWTKVLHLGVLITAGALVFLALAWLLRCPEIGYLKGFLQRRPAPPLTSRED